VILYLYNEDHYLKQTALPKFPAGHLYKVERLHCTEKNGQKLLGTGKLMLVDRRGKVLVNSPFVKGFQFTPPDESRLIKAKLLTEKNGVKIPVQNAKVILNNSKNTELASARTNQYGDFELKVPGMTETQHLRVESIAPDVDNLILASQEGVERAHFIRNGNGFEYKMIASEIVRMSEIPEQDDLVMELGSFVKNDQKELRRLEYINFPSGSYMMQDDSKLILDKIAQLMNENQLLHLEVISHTDSRGDDLSNLQLSEKRSLSVVSYLILIGVHKDRMSFRGKGETEIRNRCVNGVDCSDTEHAFNRRTEFRFSKEVH
jgi:outer membrane protein OmpA-like peptidoglycan-associated protein